jgi:hypothetical protein
MRCCKPYFNLSSQDSLLLHFHHKYQAMQKISLLFVSFILSSALFGQYVTPGAGVHWSLQEFVDNSGGVITFVDDEYLIAGDITISSTDTISITDEQAMFRVSPDVLITVNGVLLITGPTTQITFSSLDQQSNFTGFRVEDSPGSVFHSTIFNRAGGIKVLGSEVEFVGCTFQHFNQDNATGTIDVSQCSPVISECQFIQNSGPAVLSPANGSASPQILYCMMEGNVTSNANMPQINLGTSGADSIRIIGNQIIGDPMLDQVGGIAVTTLVGGSLKCRIQDNLIKNNRYGMTQYGNNIGSVIRNNVIEGNNIQGLPNLGGSGINFYGNQTNQSYVSENIITGNLWGITIQNSAQPNLGELETSVHSPGMNHIYDNGNSGEVYALYNNTPEDVWAQNNYWGSTDPDTVESYIFHQPDDPSLGLVHYLPLLNPVNAEVTFDSSKNQQPVTLFPNPADQFIEISGLPCQEVCVIRLFSLNGRMTETIDMNMEQRRISISAYSPGSYLVEIITRNERYIRKLIISR